MAPLIPGRRLVQRALVAATATITASVAAWAQEPVNALELGVKAAYLYKFSGYVEWPTSTFADPESSLIFGVMGDDALAAALTRLVHARPPGSRPATVIRPKAFESLPTVHVLFMGRAEADRLGPLIRGARGRPILVITDTENALALGSMINFAMVDGHVRFEVGLGAARRSGLTLSSRLLAVAHLVLTRSP